MYAQILRIRNEVHLLLVRLAKLAALLPCCPPFGSLQVTSTDKLVVEQLDYNHQQLLFWVVTEDMYLFAGMGTGIHILMAGIPKRRESIRSVMLRYISLETEIGVSSNS